MNGLQVPAVLNCLIAMRDESETQQGDKSHRRHP